MLKKIRNFHFSLRNVTLRGNSGYKSTYSDAFFFLRGSATTMRICFSSNNDKLERNVDILHLMCGLANFRESCTGSLFQMRLKEASGTSLQCARATVNYSFVLCTYTSNVLFIFFCLDTRVQN